MQQSVCCTICAQNGIKSCIGKYNPDTMGNGERQTSCPKGDICGQRYGIIARNGKLFQRMITDNKTPKPEDYYEATICK